MAFDGLSDKLNNVFKKLKSRGKLTEADVNEAMREVKLALLEADVSFKVVKTFVNKIKERAVGEEVLKSLTPAQQDASTRIDTSGKNAFSSMALDMTQISVHSPTRVILSIGSTLLFRSFNTFPSVSLPKVGLSIGCEIRSC